jgi:hypothetical protein
MAQTSVLSLMYAQVSITGFRDTTTAANICALYEVYYTKYSAKICAVYEVLCLDLEYYCVNLQHSVHHRSPQWQCLTTVAKTASYPRRVTTLLNRGYWSCKWCSWCWWQCRGYSLGLTVPLWSCQRGDMLLVCRVYCPGNSVFDATDQHQRIQVCEQCILHSEMFVASVVVQHDYTRLYNFSASQRLAAAGITLACESSHEQQWLSQTSYASIACI